MPGGSASYASSENTTSPKRLAASRQRRAACRRCVSTCRTRCSPRGRARARCPRAAAATRSSACAGDATRARTRRPRRHPPRRARSSTANVRRAGSRNARASASGMRAHDAASRSISPTSSLSGASSGFGRRPGELARGAREAARPRAEQPREQRERAAPVRRRPRLRLPREPDRALELAASAGGATSRAPHRLVARRARRRRRRARPRARRAARAAPRARSGTRAPARASAAKRRPGGGEVGSGDAGADAQRLPGLHGAQRSPVPRRNRGDDPRQGDLRVAAARDARKREARAGQLDRDDRERRRASPSSCAARRAP